MLPTPLISDWSSSARLTPVCRVRSRRARPAGSKAGLERVGGDVSDRLGEVGPARHHAQVAERPLVGEAQVRAAVGEREPDPDVRRERPVRIAHAAAGRSSRGARAGRPRPPTATGTCRAAGRRRGCARPGRTAKSAGPAGVPAHGARVQDADGLDGPARPRDVRGRAGPSRPRAAQARLSAPALPCRRAGRRSPCRSSGPGPPTRP